MILTIPITYRYTFVALAQGQHKGNRQEEEEGGDGM